MKKKADLPQIPTGHGRVEQALGRTGGPSFGSYERVPGGQTPPPRQFALDASLAGHNRPVQSNDQQRPTQLQRRDSFGQYQDARADYVSPATGSATVTPRPTAWGRPGAGSATGPPPLPMARAPQGGGVEQGHDGPVPYAGRAPMMTQMRAPAVPEGLSDDTNPGTGGLEQGMEGPKPPSGNSPGNFASRGDETGSAAAEGVRTRNAVRALARSRGGTPADLENAPSRMRAGGMNQSMESLQAGPGGLGINPPGAERGPGMESHEGSGDGYGPARRP
jgi:hypothetical protein